MFEAACTIGLMVVLYNMAMAWVSDWVGAVLRRQRRDEQHHRQMRHQHIRRYWRVGVDLRLR